MKIKCKNPKCDNEFEEAYIGKCNEKKYCSTTCAKRHVSYLRYLRLKDNLEYKRGKKEYYKGWYQRNKAHQGKNLLKDYYKNKDIWAERHWTDRHRKKILQFLSKTCEFCGKNEINYIFHKEYGHQPILSHGSQNKKLKELNLEKVREYCKYLVPLCSLQCLVDFRKALKTKET